MSPRPARLASIPALAEAAGVHRVTMFRRLLRLHAEDRRAGRGGWLVALGPRRKLLVCLSLLRREHPALFEHEYIGRDQHEDLVIRVAALESAQVHEKKRLNALAAGLRSARSAAKTVASGCSP